VVIGRRDLRSNNSGMHNLPVLAKGPRRCTALVHPAAAARCGVTDAGSARLIGASGHAVTVEVKVSDEVMPGVISLPHGWGHNLPGIHLEIAARRPGANLNAPRRKPAQSKISAPGRAGDANIPLVKHF
jgi:anaerobic selenocysteine-containing dehydrogenase